MIRRIIVTIVLLTSLLMSIAYATWLSQDASTATITSGADQSCRRQFDDIQDPELKARAQAYFNKHCMKKPKIPLPNSFNNPNNPLNPADIKSKHSHPNTQTLSTDSSINRQLLKRSSQASTAHPSHMGFGSSLNLRQAQQYGYSSHVKIPNIKRSTQPYSPHRSAPRLMSAHTMPSVASKFQLPQPSGQSSVKPLSKGQKPRLLEQSSMFMNMVPVKPMG